MLLHRFSTLLDGTRFQPRYPKFLILPFGTESAYQLLLLHPQYITLQQNLTFKAILLSYSSVILIKQEYTVV